MSLLDVFVRHNWYALKAYRRPNHSDGELILPKESYELFHFRQGLVTFREVEEDWLPFSNPGEIGVYVAQRGIDELAFTPPTNLEGVVSDAHYGRAFYAPLTERERELVENAMRAARRQQAL